MEIFPVIMAGGSGTRFWPASRSALPKQFLTILGSETMLDLTLRRISSLSPADHVIIVGSKNHHHLLSPYQEKHGMTVFEEPVGRNTAPCIGLAAAYLRHQGMAEAPMVILPADHYISQDQRFRSILLAGCRFARSGAIVTVGIVPTRPETGYGYLQQGSAVETSGEGITAFTVKRFVEKPDSEHALAYLQSGDYLWNGGIFIATAEIILDEMEKHAPDIYNGLLDLESAMGTDRFPEILAGTYEAFPSISVDYGIMEKTTCPLLTIPGDFGWSDVGSWESLYTLRQGQADRDGNVVDGNAALFDTAQSLIINTLSQKVFTLGLHHTVIVNTDDALLVADLKQSQHVKKIIEDLKARGIESLL